MQEMSNLDYFHAIGELAEATGGHLNKIYQQGRAFRLRFNKHGTEYNLLVIPGKRAHLTKYLEEPPKQPPHFAATLRKLLENAVLDRAEQVNFDRIIALTLRKEKTYRLVFEMFGAGNIILCDENNTILQVLQRAEYAARKLAPKENYASPPAGKKDFRALAPEDLDGMNGKIVSALSKTVNLAPFYLEEACAEAGIALGKDAGALSKEDARALSKAVAGLAGKKQPTLYLKEGKPVAFSPFPLKKLAAGLEQKTFPSLSEALDEYYRAQPEQVEESVRLEKMRFALRQQEEALKEFIENEKAAKEKAEAVYANYPLVEEILAEAKAALKEKRPESEINRGLRAKKARLEKGKVTIDLG